MYVFCLCCHTLNFCTAERRKSTIHFEQNKSITKCIFTDMISCNFVSSPYISRNIDRWSKDEDIHGQIASLVGVKA